MYIIPTLWRCPKCSLKVFYNGDCSLITMYDENRDPFCPHCIAKFLRGEVDSVSTLENTGEQKE